MKKIRLLSMLVSLVLLLNFVFGFNVFATGNDFPSDTIDITDDRFTGYAYEKYTYPITPKNNPEIWREFVSHTEMLEACEIPNDILKVLTTRQLLLTCLDYPLMGDALCYSDSSVGFEVVSAHHNGLDNLFKRSDISFELSRLYSTLGSNDVNDTDKMFSISLITDHAISKDLIDERDAEIISAKCDELLRDVNVGMVYNWIASVSQTLSSYNVTPTSADFTITTVYTKKGSAVTGYVFKSDLTAAEVAYCDDYTNSTYPNATRISGATRYYNCHSYAWYSSNYSSNHVWIDNPTAYRTDGSHTCYGIIGDGYPYPSGAVHGNIAYYSNSTTTLENDHSAIIYNSTTYTSKWGRCALLRHAQAYCPYYFGSSSTSIYIYECY